MATVYFRQELGLYSRRGPKNIDQLMKVMTVRGTVPKDALLSSQPTPSNSRAWFGLERILIVAGREAAACPGG